MDATQERYTHERLERIELKMDRLVEAVTQIARLEERIDQMCNKCGRCQDEINGLRQRIASNEATLSRTGVYASLAERGIVQLLAFGGAAILGGLFAFIQFGGGF